MANKGSTKPISCTRCGKPLLLGDPAPFCGNCLMEKSRQDAQKLMQEEMFRAWQQRVQAFGGLGGLGQFIPPPSISQQPQPNPIFTSAVGKYSGIPLGQFGGVLNHQFTGFCPCGRPLKAGEVQCSACTPPPPPKVEGTVSKTCSKCCRPMMPGDQIFGEVWQPYCAKCEQAELEQKEKEKHFAQAA